MVGGNQMIQIISNDKVKQVYSEKKSELVDFLNWWSNVKSITYLGDSFVKEVNRAGLTVYYSEFFGLYYDLVSQDVIDDFYSPNKTEKLIEKINNDVEYIKEVRK